MDADYINSNLKPTQINYYPFLYCREEEIHQKYSQQVDSWGKWMMFFKKELLDEKWSAACQLYRQGKFTGIASMKVSTAFDNERASDKNTGVIIFYCGPPRDQATMMEYGKNLLVQFPYETNFGYMYYKSDEQTALGTRATGQKNNSLYRIRVPKFSGEFDDDDEEEYWSRRHRNSDEEEEEERNQPEPTIEMNPAYTNTIKKPSEVTDHPYLFRCDETARHRYSHVTSWGKWLMFFPKNQLDKQWAEACEVYDCGRLWNVAFMKVSTAQDSDRSSDKDNGVIAFYCGPAYNRIAMLEIADNILDYIPYESEDGYMYYKSEVQSALGTRASGREKNSKFRIRVGKKGDDGNNGPGTSSQYSRGAHRARTRGGKAEKGSQGEVSGNASKKYKNG